MTNTPAKAEDKKEQLPVITAPRLPFHPALAEQFGIDQTIWRVLCESIFPAAQSIEGIALAIRYCKAQNYDIMKRPVHIVPMWNSKLRKTVETVWPGINSYRTTAARTGQYGGCDATEFGEMVEEIFAGDVSEWENRVEVVKKKEITMRYPEWARVTVYRIINGMRCQFPGPKVFFKEIYSHLKHDVDIPNDRWQRAPVGQLEKCAEAAALRKAFPEVGDVSAEEMEGKVIDAAEQTVLPKVTEAQVAQTIDAHMASVGQTLGDGKAGDAAVNEGLAQAEAAKVKAAEEAAARAENLDWFLKLEDEYQPGIYMCNTMAKLNEWLIDESASIKSMPEAVRAKLDEMIGARISKINAASSK